MREVKMNRVPFNPDGNSQPSNNNGRVPFNPAPQLREGDTNIVVPKYTTSQDLEIDRTLNFIQENSLRNMRDDEKDILKNMMKNPLTSKEELSDAIVTLQGKKAKQIDNTILTPDYYMKRDEKSGNYKPVALEQGEKIPVGYHAASIWGTKLSAKDDNAWQDIGKSLVNGVVGLGAGVVDIAQSGYELVTGDESETLRSGKNAIEGLKFEKDADLERPVYNMEGITKWADLLDKDRFDFSPQALWGTFNSTAESLSEFGLGSLTGATWIKGAKALKYGYKGLDTALDLGKAGKLGAIFTGSFFTNIGDTRDAAEEAGLQGRDKGAVSLGIATVKSAIDAAFGLEGKIMSNAFKAGEREVLKNVIKKAETDAVTGLLTKNGFKQVMKDFSTEYSTLAKAGLKSKQVVKDMLEEGSNEVATDFAQKAGEQLWDKLTPDERGQFGTDAFSAESFGQYANSFFNGAISGGMMSVPSQVLKNNHDKQSVNAYERVKEGAEAVQALKTDLNNALQNESITKSEYDQANFKIDAYQKYNEETKDVNLKPEDERKAFELSFQIEGLKTEIPTNENEISKLDPIPRGIVEGKQSQYKKLQKELTEIIERGQVKGEPVVAKKTEEAIIKDKEKETKEEGNNSKLNQEKEIKSDKKQTAKEPNPDFPIEPKVEKKPERAWIADKRTYEEIPAEEWNHSKTDERLLHKAAGKHIWNQPNHEVNGQLYLHQYEYNEKKNRTIRVKLEDGKILKLGSTKIIDDSGLSGYFHTERLKGNVANEPVGIKVVELAPEEVDVEVDGKMTKKVIRKKVIKIYQKSSGKYLAYIKETHRGSKDAKDRRGNPLYTQSQIKGELEDIKLQDEKPLPPDEVERLRNTPIVPIVPKTTTEKAADATQKIVEEAKAKVKEQKASVPLTITKAVRQQLYDLGFTKANVDLMKPDRALEVINKQETNKKEDGKQEKSTVDGEKSVRGNNEEVNGESESTSKELKLPKVKQNKSRSDRGIKNPFRKKASEIDPANAYESVITYFAGKGFVSMDSLRKFFKETKKYNIKEWVKTNTFKRQNLTQEGAPTIDEVANKLWENQSDRLSNLTTEDYKNAIEEVLRTHTSPIDMAKELLENNGIGVDLSRLEEITLGALENAENEGYVKELDKVNDVLEGKTDEELKALAAKDKWEEGTDIVIYSENKLSNIEENTNAVIASSPEGKIKLNLATSIINKQFIEKDLDRKLENIEDKSSNITDLEDLAKKYNIPFKIKNSEIYTAEGRIKMDNLIAKVNEIIENEFQELIDNSVVDFTTVGKTDFIIHKDLINSKSINISFELTKKDIDYVKVVEITAPYSGVIELEFEGETIKINAEFNKLHEIKKITDIFGEKVEKEGLSVKGLSKDIAFNSAVARKYSIKDAGKKSKELEEELNNKLSKIDKLSNEFNEALYQSIGVIPDNSLETLGYKPNTQYTLQEKNNKEGYEPFQKVSQRKGDYSKVVEVISKAFNNKNIKVVVDEDQFKGEQSTVAGKVSADGKFIYINPNYAGLDTPIHEAGHILIDAMGYNNKVIQSAIKQLRTTPLYTETKQRYKELSEQELDKEVLAEAIGREGADIFDKVEDRSKFKAYLDYIFDWLKQKLGLDKNVAKSLAKQIIGGVKTKNLEGVATGKEQLQKTDKDKKKPFAAQALKYNQYAMEEGFDAQIEFEKYQKALVELKEAEEIEQDVLVNGTQEEYKEAEKEYKAAKKEFAIKPKKYLGYLKYKKDFKAVQALLEDKDLEDYTYEELNDLSVKLHSFNDRAAKSLKARVHLKIGHKATVKQNEIHKKNEGFIEALGKTSDISPLKRKIMHISHASEKNADLQALALASGKAIIDKLSEANSLKDTHAKLGLKVIREENKRLGITGTAMNRFSSDSSKYFEWMINEDGEYLTMDEAKSKGLSQAKLDYLDFHRETVAGYRESMSANDYENSKMAAIRVDKNFREAYKSEGLIPAFSYYLGGGATNLGKVRILHNGKVMSYSEIEKEIISSVDKKSIQSIAKALYDLLVANIKARYQLKKGQNIDEKDNPLELKGDAEYSLNEKGQLVSKFDKPRNKDRGYSKDFYKAMNQFIDESAHVKHISKIMPLVEAVEYLNKNGYAEEGYAIKPNVAKWIDDWKALHIFKEPHVNDPIIDAAVKSLRKLVASTTMWFNIPANIINVFMGNYNNWRAENAETLAKGNARLFGGKGSRKEVGIVNDYALGIIKKYNLVNQDFDSHPVIKAGSVFSKLATWGTQVGEYQIQGSLGLGLLSQEEFDSFEWKEDKYGNKVLKVKEGVDEEKLKAKMTQVKNRVTDIQGKYPDEDRRNIMRGEFGKALFQFKVWMPDWFKERFGARYINAYGQEKEGSYIKMLRVGVKEMAADLKKGDVKKALTNPTFVQNLKGMIVIGGLLALKHSGDDDDEKKKGGLNWDSLLSQVLFIFDLEQDKYMVSNPAAVLGKIKDMLNAFEALVGFEEDAWQKTKRVLPGNKAITFVENQIK